MTLWSFTIMQLIHQVIQDGINYGPMSVYDIDGIRCMGRPDMQDIFRLKLLKVDTVPTFVGHMGIEARQAASINPNLTDHRFYALDKRDLLPLGEALAKRTETVFLVGAARILVYWKDGQEMHRRRLDYYYRTTPEGNADYEYEFFD